MRRLHESCTRILKLCKAPPAPLQSSPLLHEERDCPSRSRPRPSAVPFRHTKTPRIDLMISLPVAKPAIPSELRCAPQSLAAGLAVTALADWLFYLHRPGISVVIFALTLGLAVLLTNPVRARKPELFAALVILAMALLPAVEDFGILSLAFAIAGTATFALLVTGWPARPAAERIGDVIWLIIGGPFRLVADMNEVAREARERDAARHRVDWLMAWVVPLGVGSIFVALFAAANPVIENWFAGSDPSRWNIDLWRPLFWLVVIALIWRFLRVQLDDKPSLQDLLQDPLRQPPTVMPHAPQAGAGVGSRLFGKSAILRSLVLFNALFAVQTALDVAYLWAGVALPAGMSYASYAHRGAYPLIVTALLAAAFVLAAMQPETSTERSRTIRVLVFLWIGQNVLLVISSILRLDLYVDVYSLTGLRCAAFIWMLLVAAGLVLIMARIVLDRPNSWLIWRNAMALGITLYVCGFVNFPALIADFNVAHSLEMSGTGQSVDVGYLCDLGPAAIPALDALAARVALDARLALAQRVGCRASLAVLERRREQDWRAFGFRAYRLGRFLDLQDRSSPAPQGAPPAPSQGGA
jgi:hypothetical protein